MGESADERSPTVRDIHVYFNRPAGKEGTDLEDLREGIGNLEHVSEVRLDPSGNVVAVSFEGGQAEQEAIERAVEEAGYEVSRLSVRSDFTEGPNLWDI
jgi:copper chaperone CopZ